MSLALVLALAGCKTVPAPRPSPVVKITWPTFPSPAGKVTIKDGMVTMSAEYWLEIYGYVVDVEAGIEMLPPEYGRK